MTTNDNSTKPVSAGSGLSGAGGAILTLMFFLPWFSACDLNISGKDLAFGMTLDMGMLGSSSAPPTYPWLAILLLCGIAAILLALVGYLREIPITPRVKSFSLLGAGGLACLLLGAVVLGYIQETSNSPNVIKIEYGLPGALVGALMMVGGAVWDLRAVSGGRSQGPIYAPSPPVRSDTWQAPPQPPPPVSQTRALLRCQSGPLAGQSFSVSGDRTSIGRSSENHIHLPDSQASRVHAVIRHAQGRYYLQDQQSTHGTLVNGEAIQASVINDGDVITIGGTEFEFRVQ